MNESQASRVIAALSHVARFRIAKMLVTHGQSGVSAGRIAACLELPVPIASFHLKELLSAGLVNDRRDGRFVIYSANLEALGCLAGFLKTHCYPGQCESTGQVKAPPPVLRKRNDTAPSSCYIGPAK